MVERIVLKKVKNSEELILDMVSTPEYVLKSVDWGTIQGTHHQYKYVNQVGVTVTGTTLATRPISIEGWIVAASSARMNVLKRKLNSFINPQDAIDLYYDEYMIRFIPDETIKYATNESENNDAFCKFVITGTCPNPLFTNISESTSIFATTAPAFHFPLIISENLPEKGIVFGKRTDSLIINVINNGSVSSGMRIIFKANGMVINPKLINVNTNEQFILNKTLIAEEEVMINTNIGEKKIEGKIGNSQYNNYYMYKDIDSSWLQLEVGDNLFSYDADNGLENLEIFVYFNNRYLEVQECY